jgi:hypothetical protein
MIMTHFLVSGEKITIDKGGDPHPLYEPDMSEIELSCLSELELKNHIRRLSLWQEYLEVNFPTFDAPL